MPGRKKVRRSTFSNIAALEPHGRHARDLLTDDDGQGVVGGGVGSVGGSLSGGGQSPINPNPATTFQSSGYYQIADDSMKLLDHDDNGSLYNEYEEGAGIMTGTGGDSRLHREDDSIRGLMNARFGRLSEANNVETSSLDSNDLMDHRPSLAGVSPSTFRKMSRVVTTAGTGVNSAGVNSPGYRKMSKAATTAVSGNNDGHTHHRQSTIPYPNATSPTSHVSKYTSPGLVERWIRSRRSMSQLPLIEDHSPEGHSHRNRTMDYSALAQGDEDFAIAVDEDAIYDDDEDDIQSPRNRSSHSHFIPTPHRSSRLGVTNGGGVGGFVDPPSDVETLNSKPSSRRGSDASSLDDVCYPIDSPRPDSTTGPKLWPDLSVLTEFAEQELKELSATEAAASNRPVTVEDFGTGGLTVAAGLGLGLEDDRAISPFTSGISERGRYAVNEAEAAGGRLRPRRIIPWANNSNTGGSNQKNNYGNRLTFPSSERHIPGVDEKAAMEFRFTYFCEDMEATIHSPTISGLLQPGQTFASLFPPRVAARSPFDVSPRGATPAYEATETDSNTNTQKQPAADPLSSTPVMSPPLAYTRPSVGSTSALPSVLPNVDSRDQASTTPHNGHTEPTPFWLDVLNPTEEEMKVISKTFGIHPLTTEDIFLGETREKVELFRNYYLVCFRSIDTNYERQRSRRSGGTSVNDPEGNNMNSLSTRASRGGFPEIFTSNSELRNRRGSSVRSTSSKKRRRDRNNELKPLNMYIIVFHEGVLSFHFAPTTHPINVRRRARLLRDYLNVSSDWISYALIDDITDGFAPLIESIEDDVNLIEEAILKMHSGEDDSEDDSDDEELNDASTVTTTTNISNREMWKKKGDMLRQIGECRKRVMSLLRLLGSKADVIKGFSKRCNEQWEVAPRNEIGLYLGDIQDHIITMVQSLNHYEKLLARSHSNYLAQINIDMTKANNDMNDVLGRITVLGTIVVPMNVITGLWGMNVLVPGQDINSLTWFWSICALLLVMAVFCFWIARRFYKIA